MAGSLKDYWGVPAGRRSPRPVERTIEKREPEKKAEDVRLFNERIPSEPQLPPIDRSWISMLVSTFLAVFLIGWVPFSTSPIFVFEMVFVGVCVALLAGVVMWKRSAFSLSYGMLIGVGVGLALITASVAFASFRFPALFGDGAGVPALFFIGVLIFLLFLSGVSVRESDLRRAILVSGGVLLFFELFSLKAGSGWLPPDRSSEMLGALFITLFPFVWLSGAEPCRRTWIRNGAWSLALLFGLFAIGRQDMVMVAALMAGVIALGTARRTHSKRQWAPIAAGAVFLLFVSFIVGLNEERLAFSHRASVDVVRASLAVRPVVGFGPMHYEEVFTRFRALEHAASSVWNVVPREASSLFLTLIPTYGLLFTLLVYAGAIVIWIRGMRSDAPLAVKIAVPFLLVLSVLTSFSREALVLLVVFLAHLAAAHQPARFARRSVVGGVAGVVGAFALVGLFFTVRYAVADVLFSRANVRIQASEDPASVRTDLQRASRWYPWSATIELTRGQHNAVAIALGATNEEELTVEATRALDRAVAVNGSSAVLQDAILVLSDLQIASKQDLGETIQRYTAQAFAQDSLNPALLLLDAQQKLRLTLPATDAVARESGFAAAEAGFQKVQSLQPNVVAGFLGSVDVARARGEYDQAIELSRSLLTTFPTEVDVYRAVMTLGVESGKDDVAIQAAKDFASAFEGSTQGFAFLAETYRARAEQLPEAERQPLRDKEKTALTELLQRNPEDSAAKERVSQL
ncbi:MAG: hypothetical protein HYV34_03215 [Candidatus Kerfeldbacteria bacterium]|nr:hypothetical protein [Candidatus Kerfeldbacteria bacterium]